MATNFSTWALTCALVQSGQRETTAKAMFLRTVSQGMSAWLWNTTPRSRLGPPISRFSMKTWPDAGAVQSGQHVEDGGLAAAGVADDADELALADGEGHVGEHRLGRAGWCEVFAEPFDLEESLHGVFFL
jgi:hypothetical protein